MAKFTKKPVTVEAITFQELVDHGRRVAPESINGGMPWSFTYAGHQISHENDTCYLIPTLEGTMKMGPGDMLITGVKGEIYPCKRDIFEATYGAALPVIDPGPSSHASAVLYPAIKRAMDEIDLDPLLCSSVNVKRAYNDLFDAFWSETPAPASEAAKRRHGVPSRT